MLSITRKAYYGITALLELAENYEHGLLQIKDIADRRSIPRNYLEQLLNRLLKSGLVKSIRGSRGGYKLSENPEKVSLLTVLETLEGNITLTGEWSENDAVYKVMKDAESRMKEAMQITLKDIIEEQKKVNKEALFYI
jgi:Rrf2 family protein